MIRIIHPVFFALLITIQPHAVFAVEVDFERQIRPLLRSRCAECHGAEVQESGLRLDARHSALKGGDGGAVIAPGNSDESELLRRIAADDPDERMPPEGPPLTDSEVGLLRRWIDDGATWPETDYDRDAARDRRLEHWAFQRIPDVQPPTADPPNGDASTPLTVMDRFIVARLAENNLTLAAAADRRTLIRRLAFDLLGLPPSAEQVTEFVNDNNPESWRKLVDQMLESPRYGERWAQHWLDVIRYADTHGFEVNTPRENAWPYRDYVIRAFNEDKPYDQFVVEQLAGDAVQADEATGFLVAAAVLLPGQIGADDESKRLARQDALDEIINGTAATLLGLTIGCARCHDHKFDPITQRDYYAMQAFFAGVEYGDRKIDSSADRERLARIAAMDATINKLQDTLRRFEPRAFRGRTLLIDEEDGTRVTSLTQNNGPGANPAGTGRGYQNDVGSADRIGNLSRGQYTWWNNVPGQDVLTYHPGVAGRFRLWISWGAHGSGVHTRDARYLIDRDGDLATRDDQHELARVDQYYLSGIREGESEQKPLWSGLLDVGAIDLSESTKLVLRGGDTGTGITADVIVLQETAGDTPHRTVRSKLPHLRAPVAPRRNTEHFAPVEARFVRFTTLETIDNNRHEPCLDELEVFAAVDPTRNVALAEAGAVATSSGNYSDIGQHQLPHIHDGRYGNEYSWISNERGGGWVQIELADTITINRIVWGRDRNGKFQDRLPVRYRIEVSLDDQNWQLVAGHTDRVPLGTPYDPIQSLLRNQPSDATTDLPALVAEVGRLRTEKARLEAPQVVFGGTFREPDTTYVLRRGDPEQRIEEIGPAVPKLFSPASILGNLPEQERRLELARWIASPENPLTARVMVNRIWLYHFGRGLVDTPSDFGLNGPPPSHPELLDWLAGEFVRSGWSIKHIHRLILLSATYRQSSRIDPQSAGVDRDNRWLWRFPSRRLEGEAIRDCMLATSGELNLKMGGPGFNFFRSRGGLNGFPPVEDFGPNELRRMVYAHKIRMEPVPVFGAFDCPDAGQATPRRSRSTTAIQALNLLNSRFVAHRAAKFASRIHDEAPRAKGESPENVENQVVEAFQLALARGPSAVELAASAEVVRKHGLSTLCRVLFNSNEFLFVP